MNTSLRTVHLEMFAHLGIGPELLEQAGVISVTDEQARTEYGITGAFGQDMSGIMFPYFDPLADKKRVTCRLRRDNPEIENAKPKKKYLAPYGDHRHLYFVRGCVDYVKDAAVPILLVEAEKSVLALTAWSARTSQRILPVGMGGAWGWRGRIGMKDGRNCLGSWCLSDERWLNGLW